MRAYERVLACVGVCPDCGVRGFRGREREFPDRMRDLSARAVVGSG